MAQRLNSAHINALASHRGSQFDGGTLRVYTGTQPASANDAVSGTLLADIALPSPAFGAASGGTINKSGTWSATAAASGTAGWARFTGSGGQSFDANVTATGGGGEVTFDDVEFVAGGTVTVNSASLTQPDS